MFLPIIEAGVDSTAGSIFVYSYNSTNITTNIDTAVLSRQVALGRDTVGEKKNPEIYENVFLQLC